MLGAMIYPKLHRFNDNYLSPGRWTAGMAERELTKLILSMELVGGGGGGDC